MKKLLKLLSIATIFSLLIYHFFLYTDLQNNCIIKLKPTFMPSNLSTKETIKLIKHGSPANYTLLCKHVNTINKNPSCGGFDGGCFSPRKPKTIYIGNDQGNPALAAAIVVHETCHAIQHQENRGISEKECYTKGSEFLDEVVEW